MNATLSASSAAAAHHRLRMEGTMFARFSIVCLVVMLFGMAFASVVANSDRGVRKWQGSAIPLQSSDTWVTFQEH
jgi:hypothetical protein